MNKLFLLLGFLAAGAACLAAEPSAESGASVSDDALVQPQWLLNLDGLVGGRTAPAAEWGHGVLGAGAGFEYVPASLSDLGFNAGYEYLAESRDPLKRDSTLDFALRAYVYTRPAWSAWLKVGAGVNTTPNSVNGRQLEVIEPGVRVALFSHAALDMGIQYMAQGPSGGSQVQSFGLDMGLSIPLGTGYSLGNGAPAAQAQTAAAPPPASGSSFFSPPPQGASVPLLAGTPAWAGGGVVVHKGEDLWSIAQRIWGDGALWPLLYIANRDQVPNPDAIRAGAKLWYRASYTPSQIAAASKQAKTWHGRRVLPMR